MWRINGGRVPTPEDTLDLVQRECAVWQAKNFPASREKPVHPLLGVVEEVGELAHAFLKCEQGIRGTPEEHADAMQDAVGDMLIFLMDFCTQKGWRVSDLLKKTWGQVKLRDWTKNKSDGKV
jgi:NTP pyrophosphatase (non-canonical NTP hydrolase)